LPDLLSCAEAPWMAAGAGCGCSALYRECERPCPGAPLDVSFRDGCCAFAGLSRDSLLRELEGRATLLCS